MVVLFRLISRLIEMTRNSHYGRMARTRTSRSAVSEIWKAIMDLKVEFLSLRPVAA
jgi:hypothetical protein